MNTIEQHVELVIIGAGAAGMMCAIEAGKRGRKVIILEHNDQPGKKIRISGGGRCNFTNITAKPANYISHNEHFAKSALARFTPKDFLSLVHQHGIPYHEKKLGQLFCDNSAQDIISMLKEECNKVGVKIIYKTSVTDILKEDTFIVRTSTGTFTSDALVIACGGLSIPTLGTSDLAYKTARSFNISTIPCRPGLVPLTLSAKDLKIYQPLAGVSVDTIVSIGKIAFRENILFTHKGLSGPAILQISSYWQPSQVIIINLIPDKTMSDILTADHARGTLLKNYLKDYLPSRLCDVICDHFFANKALKEFTAKEIQDIGHRLNHWPITPSGTEGYAKAEVTLGGIDTKELSSKTMGSNKVPGLFFIGEAVDVTGHLGGYNFQWAWASGFAAGQYA